MAALAVAAPAMAQEDDAARLAPVLLDVSINGIAQDVTALLRGPDGTIYAPAAAISAWRLRIPTGTPVRVDGEPHYPLTGIAGVKTSEDEASQRLDIEAAPSAFESSNLSMAEDGRSAPDAQGLGAYVNYDILAERTGRAHSLGGSFEAILFTPKGVGAATAVATIGDRSRLRRLETSWTFDSPSRMASLRIGDSFTRGGVGGAPLRFGGIQLSRNFATQ